MKAIIRKDEQAVSPVIATILMVAITVVLAAVLYVMVSGLLVGPGASKPVLTFGTPTTSSGSTTVTIASVSQSVGRDNYRVNLRVNTTTGSAVALAPAGTASNVSVAGTTYAITWTDIGGEATVNAGDTFRITTAGGLPSASTFTFFLLWSDGSQIQSSSWTTA